MLATFQLPDVKFDWDKHGGIEIVIRKYVLNERRFNTF